jgi:hypothetical protein
VVSPNFDGVHDRLDLVARFSESATWTATIEGDDGARVRTQSGSGHQAFIEWDGLSSGAPAAPGGYTWHLHASDAWGNTALDDTGDFSVVGEPVADTGVVSFTPAKTVTTSSTVTYTLRFAGPVTGLGWSDLLRQGTATGCAVGGPTGGPTTYTITVSGCSTGNVNLSLAPRGVASALGIAGPAGTILAPRVTIDRTAPTVSTPRAALRNEAQLAGVSTSQPLPVNLAWTGSDGGAGIASYDVKRSVDGGAYERIASVSGTSLAWTMTPGHGYGFKVRARDKAGNLGSWVGGSTWTPSLLQQENGAVSYTGAWTWQKDLTASGASVRSATTAGAATSVQLKGRSIGWLTSLGPDGGVAAVYVDGALAATVDTTASTTTPRVVAFTRSWSSYASHNIRIVVLSGRISLDAFALLG